MPWGMLARACCCISRVSIASPEPRLVGIFLGCAWLCKSRLALLFVHLRLLTFRCLFILAHLRSPGDASHDQRLRTLKRVLAASEL